MMHCDEVFEILTRGPFPTGAASDGLVEAHLARCADCRRLAEALRPAMVAAPESVAPEEGISLPCYGGTVAGGNSRPSGPGKPGSQRYMAGLPGAAWTSLGRLGSPLLQFAAAAAVGTVLAVGVVRWDGGPHSFNVARPAEATDRGALSTIVPARPVLHGAEEPSNASRLSAPTMSGGLPRIEGMRQACLAGSENVRRMTLIPAVGQPAAETLAYQCCTHCHAAGIRKPAGGDITLVVAACRACH